MFLTIKEPNNSNGTGVVTRFDADVINMDFFTFIGDGSGSGASTFALLKKEGTMYGFGNDGGLRYTHMIDKVNVTETYGINPNPPPPPAEPKPTILSKQGIIGIVCGALVLAALTFFWEEGQAAGAGKRMTTRLQSQTPKSPSPASPLTTTTTICRHKNRRTELISTTSRASTWTRHTQSDQEHRRQISFPWHQSPLSLSTSRSSSKHYMIRCGCYRNNSMHHNSPITRGLRSLRPPRTQANRQRPYTMTPKGIMQRRLQRSRRQWVLLLGIQSTSFRHLVQLTVKECPPPVLQHMPASPTKFNQFHKTHKAPRLRSSQNPVKTRYPPQHLHPRSTSNNTRLKLEIRGSLLLFCSPNNIPIQTFALNKTMGGDVSLPCMQCRMFVTVPVNIFVWFDSILSKLDGYGVTKTYVFFHYSNSCQGHNYGDLINWSYILNWFQQ